MFKHTSAIGADIGHFSLNLAVVSYAGEIIESLAVPLSESQDKKSIIDKLSEGISEIRQEVAVKGINPICVGISAKGFIDHQAGVVLGPDQGITGWKNVPVAKLISTITGLPAFVGNDANLMTIAEHRFGVAKDFDNVVFVALRTGIGGGIIINGKLYRGVNNAGGEIGQMIINYDDGLSDKGIRGSFEHMASASALVRRYAELAGIPLNDKEKSPGCKEIFELSYKKDRLALKAVAENAELVGIGLANLITIFAPEIIVLGGGMAEAADSYLKMVRKSAFANSLENCRSEVRIERALLGSKAALTGAAFYSLSRLEGKSVW
ncbi:MAG TPA: ROK family protein [Bacteroidales bacterium]|nr:ROK family protein [Bacteroidales bacterium]